jgi:Kdo2-lipid IVA lauroyltransferase/acyltransferase
MLNLLVFRLLKYRVELVRTNLTLSFPEKTSEEIEKIIENFYRNFFDIFLETVKILTISEQELKARMAKGNVKVLEDYYAQDKSIILAFGHFGNWEMGAISYQTEKFPHGKGVYKPMSNTFFDELMIKIRTRFGGDVYPMEEVVAKIRENINQQSAVGLIADQNPSSHNAYWYKILGRETPVFTSVEMIAKRFDFPVVYYKIDRLGRGMYQYNAELLSDRPSATGKFEITHKYFELIERDIKQDPSNWLWTHNRWKRSKDDVH